MNHGFELEAAPGGAVFVLIHLRTTMLFLLALCAALCSSIAGQTLPGSPLDLPDPGAGSIPLSTPWQFHLGDDPAWCQPGLDVASWENIRADAPWGARTHPAYTGFAWYRKRIAVHRSLPLAVLIPPVQDAYEVFWNGRRIGTYGELPPSPWWWFHGHSAVYLLPRPSGDELDGILAVRVWKAPLGSQSPASVGGFTAVPQLGAPGVLAQTASEAELAEEHSRLPDLLTAAILLSSAAVSFALFLRRRSELLLLWLALALLGFGVGGLEPLNALYFTLHDSSRRVLIQLTDTLQDIPLWLILLTLLGLLAERSWRRRTVVIAVLYSLSLAIDVEVKLALIHYGASHSAVVVLDAVTTAVYTCCRLFLFFILAAGLARRQSLSIRPLAVAASLYGFWNFLTVFNQGRRYTHWTLMSRLQAWSLPLGTYRAGIHFILDLILFVALIFTVWQRQAAEQRRQSYLEAEVKSAGEVQHVLIPEALQTIAGLTIATAYHPAQEVGGDLFQILPLPGGNTLIVLGDVSGKGLPAAMTVSFVVGAVRSFSDFTSSPSEILARLNHKLLGRGTGFTTAMIARISPSGTMTLANAGHLPPYLNGHELAIEPSLPLGLVPDSTFPEQDFQLTPGDHLTLLTDGIPEAACHGELFGFSRTQQLSSQPPSTIAEAARSFGQTDDITVLSVVFG